jgi:hypothetical protein
VFGQVQARFGAQRAIAHAPAAAAGRRPKAIRMFDFSATASAQARTPGADDLGKEL